jgi:predicted ATPase
MENRHRLNSIQVSGFKSIHELELEIRDLNILIGPNGAGKSNFIELFRFIRELVEERMQVYVARKGGAEKMLYYGSKVSQELKVSIDIAPNYYSFKLVPGQGDRLVFEYENCSFDIDSVKPKRYHENINQTLTESDLGAYSRQKPQGVGKYVYNALKEWRVYHFHDTSDSARVKKMGKISDVAYLREDASNLAAFLLQMQNSHPKHYQRIVKTIQLVIPFFRDFRLQPAYNSPEHILLEWTDQHSDVVFGADDLSDGSLRFICLTALLLQPQLPNLILLDEPELGLHPMAIQILAGLLRKAAHSTQLIVCTQSPNLVSEFVPEDIIVVEHQEGASTFLRVGEGSLNAWLEEYSLGELWQKNVIGGRP